MITVHDDILMYLLPVWISYL